MDKQILREKLRQALKITVKSALFLSPAALLVCGPSPTPFVSSQTFPFTGDAGELLDGGCLSFCDGQPAPAADPTFVGKSCGGVITLSDGGEAVICDYAQMAGIGRRLAWLQPGRRLQATCLVGALFAEASRFEAASVTAFRHLASELQRHRAPRSLVARARVAAADEVRHARSTARLAHRFGGTPSPAEFGTAPEDRTLAGLAMENAVEGCVRETHGALVAGWQARFAEDRGVRRALSTIATEEVRHAELGWAVAAWAEPKLGRAARKQVREARHETLRGLVDEVDREVPEELIRIAGLPTRRSARALARNLARELSA